MTGFFQGFKVALNTKHVVHSPFTWRVNGSLEKGDNTVVPISMDAMQAGFLRTQNTSGCKTWGDLPSKVGRTLTVTWGARRTRHCILD